MEGADIGFGAFEEADFSIQGQVAFALSVERDTRGLGMRPCPVFHGIDQLTLNPSMAFCEFGRHRDFFGRTDDRDPKKLVCVIQSDQRDIAREASLDEEANELPRSLPSYSGSTSPIT